MKRNGFTLIEIVVAIAVLSIAIIPFMMVLTQNLRASVDTKQRYIGANYAKALAEEIKLKKFGTSSAALTVNGDITAISRNGVLEDVDDYNGYDEENLGGAKGIRDIEGQLTDTGYFRKVNVVYVNRGNFEEEPTAVSGTVKKVTVATWVTEGAGNTTVAAVEFYVSDGG